MEDERVYALLELGGACPVILYDDDVLALRRQAFGEVGADRPRPHDDYPHGCLVRFGTEIKG